MSLCMRAGSIHSVVQLELHKPTIAIGHSLRMCTRHIESTNPGRNNMYLGLEAEMSNRLRLLLNLLSSGASIRPEPMMFSLFQISPYFRKKLFFITRGKFSQFYHFRKNFPIFIRQNFL